MAMEEQILFVDDDANILEAYKRKLQHVLHVHTAEGPHVGLREIQEKGPFAVVVADMNMPLMNGVEFLKKVQEVNPDTVRIMLTGNSDIKTAMDAVNEGSVFRFLTKPCPSRLMGDSLAAAIRQYRLLTAERELLEGTLTGIAELLTEILSWTSPDAFGRTIQLRNSALSVARKLKIRDSWEIGLAATLSQLGILAVPSEVLSKASVGEELAPEEEKALEDVPSVTKELIERIPRLDQVAQIVLYQDKRYDGGGYPQDEVSGQDIPLGSRILKAAKDLHERRSQGKPRWQCLKEMRTLEGAYDPEVLRVLAGDKEQSAASQEKRRTVSISFAELTAGLTLAAPVLTLSGRKLVAEETEVSGPLLVRLSKYVETRGIQEPVKVYV